MIYTIYTSDDCPEAFEKLNGKTFKTVKDATQALCVSWDHVLHNGNEEYSAFDQVGRERALIIGTYN